MGMVLVWTFGMLHPIWMPWLIISLTPIIGPTTATLFTLFAIPAIATALAYFIERLFQNVEEWVLSKGN